MADGLLLCFRKCVEARLQLLDVSLPLSGDQPVHPQRRLLVDRHVHALAEEPSVGEVFHKIDSDFFESLRPLDELELLGETPGNRLLLGLVEIGCFEEIF